MTPELKAAMAIYRAANHAQCPDHWTDCNAARTLADAFLAEHPVDDDTPLSVDWIASLLPHNSDSGFFQLDSDLEICDSRQGWRLLLAVGEDRETVCFLKTRRDVRQFASALKITLKNRDNWPETLKPDAKGE